MPAEDQLQVTLQFLRTTGEQPLLQAQGSLIMLPGQKQIWELSKVL
jgi:hypothetical protein